MPLHLMLALTSYQSVEILKMLLLLDSSHVMGKTSLVPVISMQISEKGGVWARAEVARAARRRSIDLAESFMVTFWLVRLVQALL